MSCLDCRTASVMNTIALAYIEDKDPKLMMNLIALQLGANVDDVTHACGFKHLKCPPIACDLQDYQAFYFGCFTKRLYIYNITGEFYSPDFSALVEESADGATWTTVTGANGTYYPTLADVYYRVTISCGRTSRILTINAGDNHDYVVPVLYKVNNGVWNNVLSTIDVNMTDTIELTLYTPMFGVNYVLSTTGAIGSDNTATITVNDIIGVSDTLTCTLRDANGCTVDVVTTINFT